MPQLKLLHITDIHSNFKLLERLSKAEAADILIISGDITHFGNQKDISLFSSLIEKLFPSAALVFGNCDTPVMESHPSTKKWRLNSRPLQFKNVTFLGISGSLPCLGTTPYELSENEFHQQLKKLANSGTILPREFVFVTHQPPINTLNDQLLNSQHVGPKSIRSFIETMQPKLCLTGHIHEARGTDHIGNCIVHNPGPFREGYYSIITLIGKEPPKIEMKQLP